MGSGGPISVREGPWGSDGAGGGAGLVGRLGAGGGAGVGLDGSGRVDEGFSLSLIDMPFTSRLMFLL